jgi:two-component system, NarL family, response regulator DevR
MNLDQPPEMLTGKESTDPHRFDAERALDRLHESVSRLDNDPAGAPRIDDIVEMIEATTERAQPSGGIAGLDVEDSPPRTARRPNSRLDVTFRVFLLDRDEIVRRRLREALEAESDMTVVGDTGTARVAAVKMPLARPDVVVLDTQLPDSDGIEVWREIRSKSPETACLILTSFADDEAVYAAIMAGVAGFVLKKGDNTDLVDAVRWVGRGESLLDPAVTSRVLERLRGGSEVRLAELSAQENRVLELIAEGLTNRQIGERMWLAEKTVRNYVSNLLAKLGMRRRAEAAAYAARQTERVASTTTRVGSGGNS